MRITKVILSTSITSATKELEITSEELMEKIENIVRSKFPESLFSAKFTTNLSPSIYIQFALGSTKDQWKNGIIHNDPAYNTFWIRGMDKEGVPIHGYTLEASQVGLYTLNYKRIKIPWRDIKKPVDSKLILKCFEKYFSALSQEVKEQGYNYATASTSYTFEQMNSGFAYMDGILKEIDEIVRRSEKGIGTSWEAGAVKRYRDAELQGLKGKKYGNWAAAKIAAQKATTFAELRKAILKLEEKGN
jgi:hypothetical protein